ncbi:MAG: Uma2 family endonuclease [Planctomycetes bacterium]|nr:Uma2 family endonuclease [Planctomycetota bacterium]
MNAIFPIRRFTVDEVMRMVDAGLLDDGERLELIDGALVTMSPQNPPHATTTEVLGRRLEAVYSGTHCVRHHCPLMISPVTLPEPDLVLLPGCLVDYGQRHPVARDALLIVEVSHTTQRRDRAKARIYAEGGAPTYWILDLQHRKLTVHTIPQGGTYAHVVDLGPDDHVTLPQLDVVWRVGDLFP